MNDQNKFQESKLSIEGQKSVLVRLARVIGHLQSIKRQERVDGEIDFDEVLTLVERYMK